MVNPNPLEKVIEEKVCDYAKSQGWLVYKFTSPARHAVPDRLLLRNGRVIFIEFKRGGEKPSPPQEREHKRLRDAGITVYVIDNVEDGKRMIDAENP
jgi:hypothetical protein